MDFEVLKEHMRKTQQDDDIDYYSHLTIEEDSIVFTASKDYDKAFGKKDLSEQEKDAMDYMKRKKDKSQIFSNIKLKKVKKNE